MAFRQVLTPAENAKISHPSQAESGCSRDQRLRDKGFVIADRPNAGPVMWWRADVGRVTETRAHMIISGTPAKK